MEISIVSFMMAGRKTWWLRFEHPEHISETQISWNEVTKLWFHGIPVRP